jgi:hypothetical protein
MTFSAPTGPWHGEIRTLTYAEIAAGRFTPWDDLPYGSAPGEYVHEMDAPHLWTWHSADPAEQANAAQFKPLGKPRRGFLSLVKRQFTL